MSNVDLSKLPAPDLVEALDYEVILAAIRADAIRLAGERGITLDLRPADPATVAIEAAAYRELLLRERVNDASKQNMIAFATKGNLDNLAAPFGVLRQVVTPANPTTGTAAVVEDDEAMRRRVLLAPESYSVAGPEGAYQYHALSADGRVLDASATSPEPGVVVVTVLSSEGNGAATSDLLDAVRAIVGPDAADAVRPLGDDVRVQSAEIIEYKIRAQVFTFDGPDSSVVLANSGSRGQAYANTSRRLGRDVPLSSVYAALTAEGVQRVVLLEPLADIVCDKTQATYCTGIEITPGGIDD